MCHLIMIRLASLCALKDFLHWIWQRRAAGQPIGGLLPQFRSVGVPLHGRTACAQIGLSTARSSHAPVGCGRWVNTVPGHGGVSNKPNYTVPKVCNTRIAKRPVYLHISLINQHAQHRTRRPTIKCILDSKNDIIVVIGIRARSNLAPYALTLCLAPEEAVS
jgi:hypothetical protein